MCLYLLVMHEKQNESVFLFPPLKWDTLSAEFVPVSGKQLSYVAAYKAFKKLLAETREN